MARYIDAAKKERLPVAQFLRRLVWEKMKGSVNNDRA